VIDLVVLVADNRMALSVKTILKRFAALHIREITFEVFPHPKHDPGVLRSAHQFLRPLLRTHRYALVLFDRDGCGSVESRATIAEVVQANLDVNGWRDRSAVCVIDPELELWVWSRSPHVAQALGWRSQDRLDRFLIQAGFLHPQAVKPDPPKEAMEAALRHVRRPMSSSIYRRIAATVPFAQCADPSFLDFAQILQGWFGIAL
jgi:hypothetical protein